MLTARKGKASFAQRESSWSPIARTVLPQASKIRITLSVLCITAPQKQVLPTCLMRSVQYDFISHCKMRRPSPTIPSQVDAK